MSRWARRVRGALAMGIAWALVWAPMGVLLGLLVDPDGSMDEPWVLVGAYPGFLGGVVFAVVLAVAARRRGIDELSVPRFAAWGAIAGLLVGVLPFVAGDASSEVPAWLPAVVVGAITLLSAGSAAASLALARRAGAGALPAADTDVSAIGADLGVARERLGAGAQVSGPGSAAGAERERQRVERPR